MFSSSSTIGPLELALFIFAPLLFVGCVEAPEGIKTTDGSKMVWSAPDTVAVPVSGEPAAGEATAQDADWRSPDSDQEAWLDEHGFDSIETRYSEARTKALWLKRLRTLRGLIGREHIPEAREAVVRELAIETVGSDEHLGLELSEDFEADRFQERLGRRLGLEGATREEVQSTIDSFESALEDYRERRVSGHVYYAQSE
jgi:hypothetical protein